MEQRLVQLVGLYPSYARLIDMFSDYKNPKSKIYELQKKGEIVKIRRGLYTLGAMYHSTGYNSTRYNSTRYNSTVCREVLANMIFGPSYVSLEYALSYYGMIPERVEVVTSICFKKKKLYVTPFGKFEYRQILRSFYGYGIELVQNESGNFLIASKERAIVDLIYFHQPEIKSVEDARSFLIEDRRIEEEDIHNLSLTRLKELTRLFNIPAIEFLYDYVSLETK